MKGIMACVAVALGVALARTAGAEAYGIDCGVPTKSGTITIVLTAPDGSYEILAVPISDSDTAEDKAELIEQYVNTNSTKFAASANGSSVGFSMAGTPPQPVVKNCGCVTDTAEGQDLLYHDSQPSDGKEGIVTLTGTPSSGVAWAGIPGVAVADVNTGGYSTAAAVLNALDAELATLGMGDAYVNASNELVIPITDGTEISWGTTDGNLISGVEIE
jgi:hypothetical protein